jgi:TolA-binding protein
MRWLTCRIPTVAGMGLLAWSVASQPAAAQIDSREGIALQNQIYQLRQEIQQLRDQAMRGGGGGGSYTTPQPAYRPPPGGDIVTQLLTRVDALEEQVRDLRGQLDQTQHAQQQQAADLGKRIDDLSFQMGAQGAAGGQPGSLPPSTSPGPQRPLSPPPSALGSQEAPPPTPPAGTARRTPELALQEGNLALNRRDYAAAEAAAREVLNNYRTSPRAYDAQFLLAQALAGERQYPQSAIAYDDAYNRNRKGAHAQDALLGLASTLTALNEKKAACDTLVKLGSEFPQLRPDLREQAASVRQRAGCK